MAVDPLAEIVTLLQPAARFSKLVECAGSWRIHREATGEPFYCAILEGSCRLTFDEHQSFILQAGDFVLAPAMRNLVNESIDAPADLSAMIPTQVGEGHFRVGRHDGPADLRMRIGHCSFGAPDSALLVSLLPDVVLVRDRPRLATLMQLVDEETREQRAAREIVLERLTAPLSEIRRCGTPCARIIVLRWERISNTTRRIGRQAASWIALSSCYGRAARKRRVSRNGSTSGRAGPTMSRAPRR
ncbi:cupin domain-containing protein [Shinella sp. BYT-45]|uniref:cupin domain-containing protein n=1 Tax=Shinella sp. BYT-45 TaxID=3377377 RepID=UPI00397FC3D8